MILYSRHFNIVNYKIELVYFMEDACIMYIYNVKGFMPLIEMTLS